MGEQKKSESQFHERKVTKKLIITGF